MKNSSSVVIGTGVADANGNYTVVLNSPATAKQTVKVYATDLSNNLSAAKSVTAPAVLQTNTVSSQLQKLSAPSFDAQLDSMVQAMASFAPGMAAETRPLVSSYSDVAVTLTVGQ